ncbi:PQ loop repeat protein [Talaromyces proteolyticus]|uniref:PQ loop repeat protein n=1 Tax=Talaromyces proteolyticus TaxID=1131652 RepID=A0AAD4KXI5_9EURO|nr:PQ loop repeat protein [Talaromyces proteolyticus]KAH8702121.1 PQ loop repeat protein [Talaromyces proteolyticus]
MWLFDIILEYAAPFFLVTAPITSYADQIYSIHKSRSSAGFSLDIPLIMLVASIVKIFYWFGDHYAISLLLQAVNMTFVQLFLLKIALNYRPTPGAKEGIEHVPFSGQQQDHSDAGIPRPYNFWRWRKEKPYWTFLVYFSAILFVIQVFCPFISRSQTYIGLLGYSGLGVEAFLPVPQVLANQRSRSCKGFRLSVLVSWLLGDAMKMSYLFYTKDVIPPAFKFCAIFQCICDCYLGIQYLMYGNGRTEYRQEKGDRWGTSEKDIRLG